MLIDTSSNRSLFEGGGPGLLKGCDGSGKRWWGMDSRADRASGHATMAGAARQRTLKGPIQCTGVALHTGATACLSIKPGDVDSGICFVRTDVAGSASIPALWDRVADTRLCTTLANEQGITIGTVEHLMAAFAGCGVDNAVVEIDGPEVPIMDGSAQPFVFLIECAGVVEQPAPRRVIRVLKEVVVDDGRNRASLAPSDRLCVDLEIDFNSSAVSRQAISLGVVNGTFCRELARARTFGFLNEVEQLQAAGFARGGSLDNAIVVNGDQVLNEGGLRYGDEFVRHKALDAIGDLYLAGGYVIGRFRGFCSGHQLNNRLLRALFADSSAWRADVLSPQESRLAIDGGITVSETP